MKDILFFAHSGLSLDSWVLFGTISAAAVFLLAFCVYKIFVLKALIKKEIVWLDESAVSKAYAEGKLLGKICTVFTVVLVVLLLLTSIITSYVTESTFIKRERFDDPDSFITYMQSEYDAWYEEGYGDLPVSERPSHDILKKWAEIDGKAYYYNPVLFESIHAIPLTNGEWEIVVTTEAADQTGETLYTVFCLGLLSLYGIKLAVSVIWYLVKTKKTRLSKA